MELISEPWTCRKAALYWTRSREQAAVYLEEEARPAPLGPFCLSSALPDMGPLAWTRREGPETGHGGRGFLMKL